MREVCESSEHRVFDKTFGRSYDRIYRRSGLRPDGLWSYVGA